MKSPMKFLLLSICLVAHPISSSPIKVDDLFTTPDVFEYQVNPKLPYIAKYYFKSPDLYVIDLYNINTKRQREVIHLTTAKNSSITDFFWIDQDSLFIEYRVDRKKVRVIRDIDFEIFESDEKGYVTSHFIQAEGEIIDSLREENDQVLFRKGKDAQVSVYRATVKNLVDDAFDDTTKFKYSLDNAITYVTDRSSEIRFAITADVEQKEILFWYLNEKKEWRNFYKLDDKYEFRPIGLISTGKLAVITNKNSDLEALVEFDLESKELGKVLYQNQKYDLVNATLTTSGELESVSYFDHGRYRTDYFTEYESKYKKLIEAQFPNKQFYTVSENSDESLRMLFVFDSNDPGNYYLFDTIKRKFEFMGNYASVLEQYSFSKTETFEVQSESDSKIEVTLTLPKKSNGVLLVTPHGGPVGVRDYDVFNRENQYYASRGFSILNINFRGSSGYGKQFLQSGRGQFGKIIERDIALAVSDVKKRHRFNKMCAMGASYGGYSAMMLAIAYPKEYDCVIAMFGVYDLPLLFNTSNLKVQKAHREAVSRVVGEFDDSLKDYSPIYLAEKVDTPVLLIAGKEDKISGFEQSNRMKYRLNQLSKDVETLFYENTGHGHHTWRGDKHLNAYTYDFLQRKLQLPIPDNESAKQALGNDLTILADGFEFEGLLKLDKKRAFELYQKAAQKGEPRAIHNVGSYYHRGQFVDKNTDMALEYYIKASELGYESASTRLGEIFKFGYFGEKDLSKAYFYFERAMNQGQESASVEVVRAICAGMGTPLQMQRCLKLLESDTSSKLIKENLMSISHDTLFSDNITSRDSKLFIDYLSQQGYKSARKESDLIVTEEGRYAYSRARWRYRHYGSSKKPTINKDDKLGVKFDVDRKQYDKNDEVIVKVIWTHPPLRASKESEPETTTTFLTWFSKRKNISILYKFDKKWKLKSGKWRLEIKSLTDDLLYTREYNVTAKKT